MQGTLIVEYAWLKCDSFLGGKVIFSPYKCDLSTNRIKEISKNLSNLETAQTSAAGTLTFEFVQG